MYSDFLGWGFVSDGCKIQGYPKLVASSVAKSYRFSQTGIIGGASSFSRNCASLCPHPESLQPLPGSPNHYLSSIIPSFSIAVVLAASSGLNQLNLFHHEVLRKLNKNSIFTLFENYSKCRIWIFEIWHFPPIFVLLKLTCLVTLFDRKLQVFQNLPKWTIFVIFN